MVEYADNDSSYAQLMNRGLVRARGGESENITFALRVRAVDQVIICL